MFANVKHFFSIKNRIAIAKDELRALYTDQMTISEEIDILTQRYNDLDEAIQVAALQLKTIDAKLRVKKTKLKEATHVAKNK